MVDDNLVHYDICFLERKQKKHAKCGHVYTIKLCFTIAQPKMCQLSVVLFTGQECVTHQPAVTAAVRNALIGTGDYSAL